MKGAVILICFATLAYALPYGSLYNNGYGFSDYPVVKTVAGKTIFSPLSTYHHLGKRSADAEADADPWLAYGYSGSGHRLYRPYGYRSYYGGYPTPATDTTDKDIAARFLNA